MHSVTLFVVDPGDACFLEVGFQLSFLAPLNHWLAPAAINELWAQQLAHVLLLEQFNPHLDNYYNQHQLHD